MKKSILLLLFTISSALLFAQSGTYQSDLQVLRENIEKTNSYKAQIKGDKLSLYNERYNKLKSDSIADNKSYLYFYNLAQLIFPLHDNHLSFYQLPNQDYFRTRESIDQYVSSKEFLTFPRENLNTDSLKKILSKKPADAIEGIYHYDKFYSVGLYKAGEKEYRGIVLSSNINLWIPGQVAIHLYEFEPGLYKAIYAHPLNKSFIFRPIEKFRNQSLVNSYFYGSYSGKMYSKNPDSPDYVNLPGNGNKFELRNIDTSIQYLLIRTFQADKINQQRSQAFFDSIQYQLTAKNLVLDLRNNEGGAYQESYRYLKLLRNFNNTGRIYVLVNNGTLSQAEILLLDLKELKNVTVLGQTTKGMLTYGSNNDKTVNLPSGLFTFYPTDMGGSPRLLSYENRGIQPDVWLENNKDWLTQAVELIKK